ncbi:MAG: hypothetical protein LBE35_06285 [Clostridiales bacterium]|jgi:hypothetical protein|nr:hypothetical protein [Clostridiales bacterium]
MRIRINGAEFLAPDSYSVGFENIGEFERNANGNLVGDLVAVKSVVTAGWKMMSGEDYGRLVRGTSPVFVELEYFDPRTDNTVRSMMYVRPGSGRIAFVSGGLWWRDVSCEFIER